ncbi:MAG TPA: phosphotransferase [Tepidisphaeraceae bacterium]|nr:phosphotransferase [Tepidisphaeraceae bacterium]
MWRLALRLKAAAGYAMVRQSNEETWRAGEFVRRVFPDFQWAAVYVGILGAAQKKTARLFDSSNRVIGYLKTAQTDAALRRLRRERQVLCALPSGVGPVMAAYGPLADGEAMLLKPISGHPLSPHAVAPPPGIRSLLLALNSGELRPPEEHPGLDFARGHDEEVGQWTDRLRGVSWPVVIQHGDLAPWNVFLDGSAFSAIDWEYGNLNGFPYLDLAYYVLTVSAVIRQAPPAAAAKQAADLLKSFAPRLTESQAEALVALSAYDAYRKALEDGDSPDEPIQKWQRAIWRTSVGDGELELAEVHGGAEAAG